MVQDENVPKPHVQNCFMLEFCLADGECNIHSKLVKVRMLPIVQPPFV